MYAARFYNRFFYDVIAFITLISFSTIVTFANCKGLERFSFINDLCLYGGLFCFVFVVVTILFLICIKKYFPSKSVILILGLYLYYILITYINHGELVKQVFLSNITLLLAMDITISMGNKLLLKKYINWANILIVLNFISVIFLFRNGGFICYNKWGVLLYSSSGAYLLAGKNGHILLLLPIMCIDYIFYKKTKKNIYLFMIWICCINSILVRSATSVVMQAFWVFAILFADKISELKKISSNYFIVIFFMLLSFYFFIVKADFIIFNKLFDFIFHKDMLTQNRGNLYSLGLNMVKEHWLVGYGYFFSDKFTLDSYLTAHNFIIDCLLYGGIIALIWYIVIIAKAIYSVKRSKGENNAYVILFGILAFLIGGFTDGYQFYPSWALFNCMCLILMRWVKAKELFI